MKKNKQADKQMNDCTQKMREREREAEKKSSVKSNLIALIGQKDLI